MEHTLRIVNRLTHRPRNLNGIVDAITEAIAIQLRHVASAWGEVVWQIVDDANRHGFEIVLLDNERQGTDYGYHDVSPDGRPYARVFVDPIIKQGGRWLASELSVSATVSHEACELVGDPAANRWAQTTRGALYAIELCDPVELDAYTVTLHDRRKVSVSNFVYPDWFNPFAAPTAHLDHQHRLRRPFEIAEGGYAMRMSGGNVRNLYGRDYPSWRKAIKLAAGSRGRARRSYRAST